MSAYHLGTIRKDFISPGGDGHHYLLVRAALPKTWRVINPVLQTLFLV